MFVRKSHCKTFLYFGVGVIFFLFLGASVLLQALSYMWPQKNRFRDMAGVFFGKEIFANVFSDTDRPASSRQDFSKGLGEEALKDVGVKKDVLGKNLDLSLVFKNENNIPVSLSKYFSLGQPVIFSIVYYQCPTLCNYHIQALLGMLKNLKWTVGKDFQVVFLSMDHREAPSLAFEKKQSVLKNYSRLDGKKGFHFLTGEEENIRKLSNQLGFKFKWLESEQIFSHPSITYILSSYRVSQMISGLSYSYRDLKLALLEASKGKIGNVIDQVLLFCYRFDPKKNLYTLSASNLMKLGGGMTVLFLFVLFFFFHRQEKEKWRGEEGKSV